MILRNINICFIPSDIVGKLDADQEYIRLKKIIKNLKTFDFK